MNGFSAASLNSRMFLPSRSGWTRRLPWVSIRNGYPVAPKRSARIWSLKSEVLTNWRNSSRQADTVMIQFQGWKKAM